MKPEECFVFSEADISFANKLLQRDEKERYGITVDLDRPTKAENEDFGKIKTSHRFFCRNK